MRLVVCLLLALVGTSYANGRAPSVSTIHFRPGNPQQAIAGATFGALVTNDGGATWRWMCEAAVGYGGTYDPDYAYASSGAIFATTFDGLKANRDGCTYEATPLGMAFASQVETPAAQKVITALVDPTDAKIYRSDDDGVSFPMSAAPGLADDWWQSLQTAPSDPLRVYLTGYRIVDGVRSTLLFTSANGGATFTPMASTNLLLSQSSTVSIVGVAPNAPLTVYAMVTYETGTSADGIYVSTDAGGSWTRLIGAMGPLAFLARANGDLVVAGPTIAKVSTNGGGTWTDFAAPSTINCFAERSDGVVWACTQNYTADYGIMASSNLATWTGVLWFKGLAGPVECAAGTVQHDTCYPVWCNLRMQFAIAADPTGCEAPDGALDGPIDAASPPPDASMKPKHGGGGCCEVSSGSSGSLVLALLVALALSRRTPATGRCRRRCRRGCDPRGRGSRSRRS